MYCEGAQNKSQNARTFRPGMLGPVFGQPVIHLEPTSVPNRPGYYFWDISEVGVGFSPLDPLPGTRVYPWRDSKIGAGSESVRTPRAQLWMARARVKVLQVCREPSQSRQVADHSHTRRTTWTRNSEGWRRFGPDPFSIGLMLSLA